jgi:hypothetical protein
MLNNYINVSGSDQLAIPKLEPFDNVSFLPAKWKLLRNQNGDSTWKNGTVIRNQAGTTNATLPSACLYINNFQSNNRGSSDTIVTSGYNLRGYRAPFLTLNYAYRAYTGNPDTLEIAYSTNCGSTWATMFSASGSNLATVPAGGTGWFVPTTLSSFKNEVLPLTGSILTNDNVQFALINRGGYGQLLYVNEFKIDSGIVTSLAYDRLLSDMVSIYPNPNSGSFNVKMPELNNTSKAYQLSVTNTVGQTVWKSVANRNREYLAIDLGVLPTGIYQLCVEIDSRKIRKSFSIER